MTLSAVRSYFEFLRSKGLFEGENPVDRAEKPKRSRKANDWLREDEDRALLDTTGNARERIVIQLLRWSGLRVSEACGLLVSDVDTERDEIRVRESKTTFGVRTVPLLPELKLALSQWLRELRARDLYSANAPLLCTSSGGHMSAGYAWRIVKRVAKRAGIRSISPHTLRRTYGSHLLNKGVRMDTVSKLLGHAHPGVTAACYAELLDQTVRDEVLRALA